MKKNRRVVGYSVIVSLGGLLFGLETAVMAGAEKPIQSVYNLSNLGWVYSGYSHYGSSRWGLICRLSR